MSIEAKKEIKLEIAHVLFIDIVGYSKLRNIRACNFGWESTADQLAAWSM